MADHTGPLGKLFDRLVKNKMSAIAIPIAMLSASITGMLSAKVIDGLPGQIFLWACLGVSLFSLGLLCWAGSVLVFRALDPKNQSNLAKGPDGRFVTRKPQPQGQGQIAAPAENPLAIPGQVLEPPAGPSV